MPIHYLLCRHKARKTIQHTACRLPCVYETAESTHRPDTNTCTQIYQYNVESWPKQFKQYNLWKITNLNEISKLGISVDHQPMNLQESHPNFKTLEN